MPEFKSTGAKDNPDSDKVEAQRERDRAEIRKQQGDAAAATGTDVNTEAIERETRLGRGAGGQNTGPSDTVSADPHNPRDNRPLFRPGQDTRTSDGMGASPPKGAQPTSDRPEPFVPAMDRAAQHGGVGSDTPAGRQAEGVLRDQREGREQGQQARGELRQAEKSIADQQTPGPGAAPRTAEDQRRDDDRREQLQREEAQREERRADERRQEENRERDQRGE